MVAAANVRGTAIKIGNLPGTRSISAGAQLDATAARLRKAEASGDAIEILASMQAATALELPQGVNLSPEVVDAMRDLRRLINSDPALRRLDELRNSRRVRAKVRRLWDLMVHESEMIAFTETGVRPESGADVVTREGYTQMHMRLAKVLMERGDFKLEEAKSIADSDWAEDISRFSGTNHITVWLDEIRSKFRDAAAQAVVLHGFTGLFARYDTDGSGDLDAEEFFAAVRTDLAIGVETITDTELESLFATVDEDGSGEVDASEFVDWLFKKPRKRKPEPKRAPVSLHATQAERAAYSKAGARAEAKRLEELAVADVKQRFKKASAAACEDIGWDFIFETYDDDGSGELEIEEFTEAVREECGLSDAAVSEQDISELFGGSGAIDAAELKLLLGADLGTPSLAFGAFFSSMFELVSLWSGEDSEDSFCNFLQSVFECITEPVNGHVAGEPGIEELSVFDDTDKSTWPRVVNFRLKSLDEIQSMVYGGKLLLNGELPPLPEMLDEPEPEPEPEPPEEEVQAAMELFTEPVREYLSEVVKVEKPAVRQRPASAPPGRGQRKLGRTAMRWGRPTLVHKAVRSKPRAVTPLLAVARLDMDADEDDEELDVVAPARLDFGRYPAPRTDVVRTRLGGGGAETAASVPMNRPRRSARPASADASVHRVPRPDATRQQALEDKTASAQSLAAELEEEAKTLATVSSRIAAKYTGPNRALLLPPGSQEPSGTEGLDDPREDDVDVLRGRYYLKVRGPPIDGWAAEGLATRTVKNDQWYTGRHMESGLQLVVPPPKEDHSTRRGRRRMTRRRWVSDVLAGSPKSWSPRDDEDAEAKAAAKPSDVWTKEPPSSIFRRRRRKLTQRETPPSPVQVEEGIKARQRQQRPATAPPLRTRTEVPVATVWKTKPTKTSMPSGG